MNIHSSAISSGSRRLIYLDSPLRQVYIGNHVARSTTWCRSFHTAAWLVGFELVGMDWMVEFDRWFDVVGCWLDGFGHVKFMRFSWVFTWKTSQLIRRISSQMWYSCSQPRVCLNRWLTPKKNWFIITFAVKKGRNIGPSSRSWRNPSIFWPPCLVKSHLLYLLCTLNHHFSGPVVHWCPVAKAARSSRQIGVKEMLRWRLRTGISLQ